MPDYEIGLAEDLLQDGEMKRIDLEDKAIVIARVGREYFAVGGKCSHYGAPLHEGVLRGHSLMCPWHHACFDIRGGKRLEPPALNDLPRYPVRIQDGSVVVSLPNDNVTSPQGNANLSDKRTFVIVGGGAAGAAACEELRRSGYTGKILIVNATSEAPLDRPNLSKDYLDGHAKAEWMPLRGTEWYSARDIGIMRNTLVTKVDPESHKIDFDHGDSIIYDKLLLATGGTPRQLKNIPGAELAGIYSLRTQGDADRIIQAVEQGKHAVIIGASFIGLEVASSLAGGRGASVTIVALEDIPFEPILGREIGQMFQKEHEAHGVQFCLGDTVTRFLGENGAVNRVELKSGKVLEADFVVVGIGVVPATDYLGDSGLQLHEKDHSVLVDNHLQTQHPDIFAAGDIARWNDTRIEHWRVAQQQGIVAARNMLGGAESISGRIPFFWTTQWGLTLNYVGHAADWDNIIMRGGSPDQKKFIAFFVSDGQLKAAAGCGYDTELVSLEFILRDHLPLTLDQMQDEGFDLIAYASGRK